MIGETRPPLRPLPRDHQALLGVFENAPPMPGGFDVKCPICSEHTADAWSTLGIPFDRGYATEVPVRTGGAEKVSLEWMRCANEDCGHAIVRVHEHGIDVISSEGVPVYGTKSWLAVPRWGSARRQVHVLVPEPFRSDYQEAAAILDTSPRMSAVMSRRVLADLLETYAGLTQFNLEARIDAFAADNARPPELRDNLHHFREGANFGAHTQKDDQAEVIHVDRDEAEWMLDLLDRLFDYFVVTPERDRAMRAKLSQKFKDAGRKAITPPPSSGSTS